MIVGLIAVVTLAWAPALWDLLLHWASSRHASHGLCVALFAAYAAWDRRAALPVVTGRPEAGGALALMLALDLLALGHVEGSLTVQALSLTLAALGVVSLLWGAHGARRLAFPLAFSLLAVPLPAAVLSHLSALTQSLAAAGAALTLTVLGVPFERHGLTLSLQGIDVVITEDCDGLPFLFACIVAGIAAAWTVRSGAGQWLTIVGLAVTAGLLANLVRVAGTVVLAAIEPAAVIGTPHQVFGKTVYLVVGVTAATLAAVLVRRAHAAATAASR